MSDTTNNPQSGTNQNPTPLPVPAEVQSIWHECEARLKLLRSDIEKLLNNSPVNAKPISFRDADKMQQVIEILNALARDPFALIERDMQDSKRAAERKSPSPANEKLPPHENAPVNPDHSKQNPAGDTNSVVPSVAPNPNNASDIQPQQIQSDAQAVVAAAEVAPASVATAQPAAPVPDFGLLPFSGAGSDSPLVNSQAAQASGERLRIALEQNTQITASLFDQMLALVDGQNRKLGEVDRKISDLNGQLNSLKNP
jgi:hypothetical protein